MQVGLRLAKIKYEGQKAVELKFKDYYVGEGYPDLIVRLPRGKMVVEPKAVGGELGATEERQIKNYVEILKIEHGLLAARQELQKDQTGDASLAIVGRLVAGPARRFVFVVSWPGPFLLGGWFNSILCSSVNNMPGGKCDSSKSRVRPAFDALWV